MLGYFLGIVVFLFLLPTFFLNIYVYDSIFVKLFFNILYSFFYVYIYSLNHIFTIILLIVFIFITSASYFWEEADYSYIIIFMFCSLLIFLVFWFLFKGTPITMRSFFKKGEISTTEISSIDINLNSIKTSLENIVNSFKEVSDNIKLQSLQLEDSVNSLLDQVYLKELELQELNEKTNEVIADLNRYKDLASLSKEEAEAIRTVLKREDFAGRIFSFLLGVLSSVVGACLTKKLIR